MPKFICVVICPLLMNPSLCDIIIVYRFITVTITVTVSILTNIAPDSYIVHTSRGYAHIIIITS